MESHSNTTKFSRQGDYFITGGGDKIVNLWKTGFYDSLKEKINGSDSTINANRKKVIPNTDEEVKERLDPENGQENNNIDLNQSST